MNMKKLTGRVDMAKHITQHHDAGFRQQVITETAQRQARRQSAAIDTHYFQYSLYRKQVPHQEECPCWTEQDPKPSCPICYGTGQLPPYAKYGYHTFATFHAATPCSTLNMHVDWAGSEILPLWQLKSTCLNGRIETNWYSIYAGAGNNLQVWTPLTHEDESFFRYEYQIEGENGVWHEISELTSYLQSHAASLRLRFRLTVSRPDLTTQVPGFPCMYLRYPLQGFQPIKGTQPQRALSSERASTGLIDLVDSSQMIVSGLRLDKVEVGDFFEKLDDALRFRVIGINKRRVNGELIEWDLQVRKVNDRELAALIP